jgi:hypothetical protein
LGCWSCKAIADVLFPIKAKTATFPDFIMDSHFSTSTINNINNSRETVPKASNKGEINKTPCFAFEHYRIPHN